ncbi:MAG: FHA domain-containing protein [Ruminococcus sp.]|nr:FHA domain-containing protein [Candidatus Copronaster equi]
MAMRQCSNGHIFDDSKNPECPYCSGENSIGKTIPLNHVTTGATGANFSATEVLGSVPTVSMPSKMDVTQAPHNAPKDQMVTEFIDSNKNSEIKPVRGWLVIIEGEKIGMDFRLHTAKNTIGRLKSNDICFDFDSTVSKENNASVIYDDRNNMFFIKGGEGSSNNVYVNGIILLESRQLKDNDIIEIGKTKLVFRSLCNDTFNY